MGKKNAEQRCSAENKIKKLCVEQKKGDNKTSVNNQLLFNTVVIIHQNVLIVNKKLDFFLI